MILVWVFQYIHYPYLLSVLSFPRIYGPAPGLNWRCSDQGETANSLPAEVATDSNAEGC